MMLSLEYCVRGEWVTELVGFSMLSLLEFVKREVAAYGVLYPYRIRACSLVE